MCGPQQKEPPSLRTSPPRSPAPLSARVSFFFCRWQRTFVVEMKFFFKIHVYLSYTHIDRHTHVYTYTYTQKERERERGRERDHTQHTQHTQHTHTHTHTHTCATKPQEVSTTLRTTPVTIPMDMDPPWKQEGGKVKIEVRITLRTTPVAISMDPLDPPWGKKGVEKEKMKSEQHRGLAPWPSSWTH